MSVNVRALREIFDQLKNSHLEKLPAKKIEHLYKVLEKVLDETKIAAVESEINQFFTRIPSEERPLFERLSKNRKLKKGSNIEQKMKYLRDLKELDGEFRGEVDKFRKIIESLQVTGEDRSIDLLMKLTGEEKKRLVLYSNLTAYNKQGKSVPYNIRSTRPAVAKWLSTLKERQSRNIFTLKEK